MKNSRKQFTQNHLNEEWNELNSKWVVTQSEFWIHVYVNTPYSSFRRSEQFVTKFLEKKNVAM